MDTLEQLPYNGTSTKLCLAFDVGTSFSSISYSILDPGQVPVIRNVSRCGLHPKQFTLTSILTDPVSRFPHQHHADRIEKVPSAIYYDQDGRLRAIGAETSDPDTNAEAADEGWIKVSWQVYNPAGARFVPYALTGSSCFSDLRRVRNPAFTAPFHQTRRRKTCSRITFNIFMTAAGNSSKTRIRMVCYSGNPYMETRNSFSATQQPGAGSNTTCCGSVWFGAGYSPTFIRAG